MDFQWGMFHLSQGRRVRRRSWPVEHVSKGTVFPHSEGDYIVPKDHIDVWHVWRQGDVGDANSPDAWAQACKGWGHQIGADNPQAFPEIGADGTMYRPIDADRGAADWEFESDAKSHADNMHLWKELPREPMRPDEYEPGIGPSVIAIVLIVGAAGIAWLILR